MPSVFDAIHWHITVPFCLPLFPIHFLYLGFKLFVGETGFELYSYNVSHSRVRTSNIPAALVINNSM